MKTNKKISEILEKIESMLEQALEDAKDEMKLTDDKDEIIYLQNDIRLVETVTELDKVKMIHYILEQENEFYEDACIEAFEEYMEWD